MGQLMIEITDITKSYGRKHVLKGASFTANAGECIAIVGANGSGKSTLLSILSGTSKPDGGSFVLNGKYNFFKKHSLINRYIGYVPQENPLITDLSVKDNLKLWYCNSVLDMEEELEDGVLHMLGIDTMLKYKVSKLSGGMKKRLSIGIAIANNPSILILDEPSAALDLVCKNSIKDYLVAYKKNKGTVIITTHDEDELSICNKIYAVSDGRLNEISPHLRGTDLLKYIK